MQYKRERINTPDGDFLDLDWQISGHNKLLIVCHGLEGNTSRPYILGMVKHFSLNGWDALAWNFRGCSEEINRKPRFYHSGETKDLQSVIYHSLEKYQYSEIAIMGFSLGGNLVLKFLGEKGSNVPKTVRKAITFSVPMDLHTSCVQISSGIGLIYSMRFLKRLKTKVERKAEVFPEVFDLKALSGTKTLIEFDDLVTAPMHGFKNAADYYEKCSAIKFINSISIPTMVVNAQNDPFLSPSCYPVKQLLNHPCVELLIPEQGGHCGFSDRDLHHENWSEKLALEYLNT